MKEELDPFSALLGIAARSQEFAVGLPAQEETVLEWSGVAFQLAGHQFVAPLGEVAEILRVPRATKVPGVMPWVNGVANVRGRLLPIVDLAGYLNLQSKGLGRNRRVLVIENGDLYSGIVVDQVFGMQYFPVDTFTQEISPLPEKVLPYVRGEYFKNNSAWTVFSVHALSADPLFMQVAV